MTTLSLGRKTQPTNYDAVVVSQKLGRKYRTNQVLNPGPVVCDSSAFGLLLTYRIASDRSSAATPVADSERPCPEV